VAIATLEDVAGMLERAPDAANLARAGLGILAAHEPARGEARAAALRKRLEQRLR
jgi:hypothetical protein